MFNIDFSFLLANGLTFVENSVKVNHPCRIAEIFADRNPLWFWEELKGLFQTTSGELLRFVLAYQIPLKKLIRYDLACRGYDNHMRWVGFDKAKEIWLE